MSNEYYDAHPLALRVLCFKAVMFLCPDLSAEEAVVIVIGGVRRAKERMER